MKCGGNWESGLLVGSEAESRGKIENGIPGRVTPK